jgi:hypothetical protein
MAISFVSPSGEVSIQDDLWHIASSSNSGQTDFKYVFDIYYKGQQLIRTKVYPEPTNGSGYFNASQVVRNEITYDWFQPKDIAFLNIFQPSTSGQIALTYDVRVGEDFSGTTILNLASGQTTAYNFIPQLLRRRKIKLSDYDNKFMSNRDKLNIRGGTLTNKIYIPLKATYNNPNPVIDAFNFNNGLAFSRSFSIFQNPSGNQFMQWDIGGRSINRSLNNNPRNLGDDIKYYEVSFLSILTDKIRIYLDCNTKYTPISLHFINAFGMFETAIFRLVSRLSMDIERKTYSKRDYSFNGNSVNYYDVNNVYNESSINYGSKIDWKYRLTYEYPSDIDYQWLAELMISPQIYMELDDNFYPVSIINNNYEYSKNINNGLRALEIDVAMNQTRYGYRR